MTRQTIRPNCAWWVLVREEGELVQMFAKSSGDDVHGLTIVSAEEAEIAPLQ